MTLTTSSNRSFKEWKQTYLWSMKKNRGMMALFTLLLFMAMPMILMIMLSNDSRNRTLDSLTSAFTGFIQSIVPYLVTPLTLVFVVVIAVSLFNYMHQKRSVDLYHALPVGRVPMLLGRYCAGLTTLFAPIILNFMIVFIISSSYGIDMKNCWQTVIISLLWLLLMSTAALTFSIFMAVCTGTTFDMVISILGVNVAYPLLVLSGSTFASHLLPGLSITPELNSTVLSAIAPFFAAFIPYTSNRSYVRVNGVSPAIGVNGAFLAWWIIFTLILLTGSILLYKKRKSECAESNFAFPIPKNVIRFMITAVAGLGLGLILETYDNSANFFIGVVTGSLAAHIVVEAIYSRGFKQLKKSFLYYGVFAAVFIVAYAALATGAFGYDTRVPNVDDVESISINAPSLSYGGNSYIYTENGRPLAQIIPTLTEKPNIDKVAELHKKYVTQIREKTFPYCVDQYRQSDFTIIYKLKNGITMKRTYPVYYADSISDAPLVNADVMINSITELKEYRETSSILFYLEPEYIKSVDINAKSTDSSLTFAPDLSTKKKLLDAMKQDYLDGKIDSYQRTEENPTYLTIESKDLIELKDGKLKTLLGDYKGKITLGERNYTLTGDTSKTKELINNLGWDK